MKIFLVAALLSVFTYQVSAQTENPKYDKALADKLGGDEYGMKAYILVILKTGSNKTDDKKTLETLFSGHMTNIERLASEGKLVVAGPLVKNEKTYRGIFILNTKSMEEATAMLATDPAIKEKLLEPELYQWYGSAALPEYLKSHEKIEKKKH